MIQRQLPIDKTYSIISSRYDPEGMICCDNCNRHITNVATIKDSDGKIFNVGMDCADTLSGLSDNMEFYVHKSVFKDALYLKAKCQREKKRFAFDDRNIYFIEHQIIKGEHYIERKVKYPSQNTVVLGWSFHSEENWNNYIYPMIKEFIL